MVGVKVICSSMGRGYIVTVFGWRKEVQPDVVNLLTLFMVAVLAVLDYFTGFPNNTIMVESYHYLMAAKS
jgi:hypothetical protein